ncbi:MAG: cation transporter [Anaerolineaceae bacterium]|nr:cation transporter [Anaerolineaceae bacterium]
MTHSHNHAHNHAHGHDNASGLKFAFFLNLTFTILEIIGGLYTNSIAILSDAVHDLGDSFALGLTWFLEKYSNKSKDRKFSYGYRRFSLLGALINLIILSIGSVFVLSEAIPRLFAPEPTNAPGMVVFALVGVFANGLAVLRLKNSDSINVKVFMLHLLEDLFGWIAVLIVSVILIFWPLYFLDSLLSILISIFILYNVYKNMTRTVSLFLQAVPEHIDIQKLEKLLMNIENVLSIHHTHLWSLDGEKNVLTTHIVVPQDISRKDVWEIKKSVNQIIQEFTIEHITLEIEFEDEDCIMALNGNSDADCDDDHHP